MHRRITLDAILGRVALEPAEAIAIVQQLICAPLVSTPLTAPLGPPTTATVVVSADGSVGCATCDTPFVVSELAVLLDAMLPAGTSAMTIPGGVRYIIARAQMEVDAPPFDSLEEFSMALARHERGDRVAVIQRLLARVHKAAPDGAVDRRSADPSVANLRRQLREADARAYDQQLAIDALSDMTGRPAPKRRGPAVAAGVFIGLLFVGTGQLMRARPEAGSGPAYGQQQSAVDISLPASPAAAQPDARPTAIEAGTPAPRSLRRTPHAAAAARDKNTSKPRRFQWLRTRFVFRADPL